MMSAYFFCLSEIIQRSAKELTDEERALLPCVLHDLAHEENQ